MTAEWSPQLRSCRTDRRSRGLLRRVTRLRLLDRRETEFKPEWLEQTIEGFLGRIMAWIDRTQDGLAIFVLAENSFMPIARITFLKAI